jgi:hypothetical protein
VQWSQVGASAGATNWYGSARQTTGYSDARARGGDWSFSEPMPQSAITGSGAYSSETRSTQTSIQHNQISRLGNGSPCSRPSAPSPAAGYRVSHHRFEARGNPVVRQQIPALCKTHLLQLLGFEDMILLRTGGLAASPPVRYTLETAEQCRVSTVPLLVSSPRFVQRVARVLASLYAAPPPPSPD